MEQLNHRNLGLSIQYSYEICTVLYALRSATRHWNFQRLSITTRRHCLFLEIEKNTTIIYRQIDFYSFTFKPKVLNSREMFIITKWTNQVLTGVRLFDGTDLKLFILVGWGRRSFVCCLVHRGSTDDLLLIPISSGAVWQSRNLHLSRNTLYLVSPRL